MDGFRRRYGFRRDEVNLSNWRQSPYSRFAFQHVEEFVPAARIPCGVERAQTPLPGAGALVPGHFKIDGASVGFTEFLERSETLCFLAMRDGRVIADWSAPDDDPGRRHLLFSITKSLTGLLAGILEDRGVLDPARRVADYIPEASGSAYGDAAIRDLLDMRVSLEFDESYLNADGDYARYRRAMCWNPPEPKRAAETLREVLFSIRKGDAPHGGPFFYASPNTDVLALVVERAGGQRYAELLSELVWHPLGACRDAVVTVDADGSARGAGGMCATPRDLALLGEMILGGGVARSGRRIVSRRWVDDMLNAGDERAWLEGNFIDLFEHGRYRSCWYQTGYPGGAFCAIGIHGQWLYVDPVSRCVLVKMSAQAEPLDEAMDQHCLAFFRAVIAVLDR